MNTPMEDWLPRHRITVDEYYGMVQAGLLAEDARVELIEGEICDSIARSRCRYTRGTACRRPGWWTSVRAAFTV